MVLLVQLPVIRFSCDNNGRAYQCKLLMKPSENVAKGLLNTFKNCSFELCLLALEKPLRDFKQGFG